MLHLMGAYQHYRLRYPANANPFDDEVDAVERAMHARQKPRWVREFRQEYDAALRYHELVVSSSLDLARQSGTAADYRARSDRGQEVGHSSHRVGHSPSTIAAYRIPAPIW